MLIMREFVYHYTSVDAFEKMLRDMKSKESNELTFWASNIHYMNDPDEMSFLYDELIKLLPELEKDLGIKEMPFSFFMSLGKSHPSVSIDLLKDIKDNVFNKIFKSAFAVSFTKNEDYLPMWALYGGSGSGLCLEFNYDALKQYFSDKERYAYTTDLLEMHYFIREIEVWPQIAAFYKYYHDQLVLNEEGKDPLSLCRSFIARVLLEMSPSIKNEAYAYEKEVRLFYKIILPGDADDIMAQAKKEPLDNKYKQLGMPKVRNKNGILIPYMEINIPIDFISKVIVGPTSYPQLQKEALVLLLKEVGQDRIVVEESTVPYRQF